MAQIGEGHEASGAAPQVLTVGSPEIGEILADRYQVEEHIGGDARGRQLYRGMDVVLRRPVTIVLRQPGGEAASEMLAAAVSASRVVHPHLVGVYDAIDEGERAYVVREWIDGISLKEAVADGPVDPARAIAITWAVADAVAALHTTGVVHGNVHPGSVMIAQDGRVMLADARADVDATQEKDVRAIGGVLYSALTGFWPHAEAGIAPLPDGVHQGGVLLSPREVRSDAPEQLDELAISLLNPDAEPPTAAEVAAVLATMTQAVEDEELESALDLGAFDSSAIPTVPGPARRRKISMVIGALVALALVGAVAAMQFGGDSGTGNPGTPSHNASPAHRPSGQPRQVAFGPGQSRIVIAYASNGNRSETKDGNNAVDGSSTTYWGTQHYRGSANFGGMREGIGIWLDLGSPQQVVNVKVDVSKAGATMELRGGDDDPGKGQSSQESDNQILATYRVISPSKVNDGTSVVFQGNETPVRYLLVWITRLPPDAGEFAIKVYEVAVTVQ